MTSANVELVRSIFAAWERGDYSSTEWADPEVELVIADGPSPGTWTGLAGVATGWGQWLSAWADFRGAAEDYRELDDDRVLVLTRASGRGKQSGLELEQKGAGVVEIRAGNVVRIVRYLDRDRALADLGLAPEAGSER
jgi:ketosteroid isomerase-like protein